MTADANTAIIAGITSKDRIFKYFAYSELKDLALDESNGAATRRTALFGDQQMSINLWNFLARESLLLLGQDYQLFLRKGKAEAVPLPPVIKPSTIPQTPFATPAPLLRRRVFKEMPDSPGQAALDALASDGPIAKAIDVGADATHVPELFRSAETKVLSSPVVTEAKKNVETAKGLRSHWKVTVASSLLSIWQKYAPEHLQQVCTRVGEWWEKERISKVVESSLPFRELDVLVVDGEFRIYSINPTKYETNYRLVLSYLICSSLQEDKYGVVQRDIPRILEAMTSYLAAIEEYQVKVTALQKPMAEGSMSSKEQEEYDALSVEIQKAQDVLVFVNDGMDGRICFSSPSKANNRHCHTGLKEGIARIVRTFGDKLLAFKFPPKVANKLQAFLDHT